MDEGCVAKNYLFHAVSVPRIMKVSGCRLFRDWILSGDMKQYFPDNLDLKKELVKARRRDMVVLIDKCYNEAIEKGKGFC